jgi:transposase
MKREVILGVWCGIDWAEHHHDVALVDDNGELLAKQRITDDPEGFRALLELLATHGAVVTGEDATPIAIETASGLLAAALIGAGFTLYAINPLAASRYRDRYAVSRAKSDPGDAFVLANILRTDRAQHRPVPADSELVQAIRVLARAQQDAVWDRQQAQNKLRSQLREYYPAALSTFADLSSPVAIEVLLLAPTPAAAARLRRSSLRAALVRAGRQRGVDAEVDRILAGLQSEQLRQSQPVEEAMGEQASAYLRQVKTAVDNADRLQVVMTERFEQHPDAELITSLPGLGVVLGARVLGELGDDRTRFADAKGVKAFAGTAPVTRSSGTKRVVSMRVVRNKRLGQASYLWAFSLLRQSPGARAHYDRRRDHGDSHAAALRNVGNRFIGILYHCLQTGQHYDETKAFPPFTAEAA